MVTKGEIEREYSTLKETYSTLYESSSPHSSALLASVKHRLMCLRDIEFTLNRLSESMIMDEIDLFEIKYLSLLASAVRKDIKALSINGIDIPDLEEVTAILDPDGVRSESFYIYDSYSKELSEVRKNLKSICSLKSNGREYDQELELELLTKEKVLEGEVREALSKKLKEFANNLKEGLKALGDLDILLAKALQIKTLNLTFPKISEDGRTIYKGMFHPYIVDLYKNGIVGGKERVFIPIDIDFNLESICLIGANMGGKSVVLKMLSLNQLLFQFGFGVAASEATIDIKEGVEICIESKEDMMNGYSSFASDILRIDKMIGKVLDGQRLLVVVDEPARTTNPIEGTVFVSSLLKLLENKPFSLILTTHYNVKGELFRRFRVNGLKEGKMDYRLSETSDSEIPQEAINVAYELKVNKDWISLAKKELDNIE